MTPLALACHTGNFPVVKVLVDSGADLMKRNWIGDTPLEMACLSKKAGIEILDYLLELDVYSANQQSPGCGEFPSFKSHYPYYFANMITF